MSVSDGDGANRITGIAAAAAFDTEYRAMQLAHKIYQEVAARLAISLAGDDASRPSLQARVAPTHVTEVSNLSDYLSDEEKLYIPVAETMLRTVKRGIR